MKKVAIVGGGIGGLSAGLRLAKSGFKVTIFEKNQQVGGKMGVLASEGYKFDTGPSVLTMPWVIDELFSFLGYKKSSFFKLKKLSTLSKYFYNNGDVLTLSQNSLARDLSEFLGEPEMSVKKYVAYLEEIYKYAADIYLNKPLNKLYTYRDPAVIKSLLHFSKIDAFRSMDKANSSFFKNQRSIDFFNRFATYNGSNPYQAPATLNMIAYIECVLGSFYIEGGFGKLRDTMVALATDLGVEIRLSSVVDEIVHSGGRVDGLISNQSLERFDLVISNVDYAATQKLLGKKAVGSKYISNASSSATVFYWGVSKRFEELDYHNVFMSDDIEGEFKYIFGQRAEFYDPTIYVSITSKKNPGFAPSNSENWFVMINTPNLRNKKILPALTETRAVVLDKLSKVLNSDIESFIDIEYSMTPSDIEYKTSSYMGSLYGLSSNSRRAAFMRPQNEDRNIKGMYYVGGSVHPGGGVPLVMLSGKIVSDLILNSHS